MPPTVPWGGCVVPAPASPQPAAWAGRRRAGGLPACPGAPLRSPGHRLLFWAVVSAAVPYIWLVEAIKAELRSSQSPRAESCQAPRPARRPRSPESVCVVTFQG